MAGHGMDLSGLGEGQMVATFKRGNESSGSIKREELFYKLRKCRLLKDSAPWSE